jgi:hypothetical protein
MKVYLHEERFLVARSVWRTMRAATKHPKQIIMAREVKRVRMRMILSVPLTPNTPLGFK